MTNKERYLFHNLCNFMDDKFNITQIDYLSPEMLGLLHLNKMQGVAYYTLKKRTQVENVDTTLLRSIENMYYFNIDYNKKHNEFLEYVNNILSPLSEKIVYVNDSVLYKIYPKGCRISDSIDILTQQSNFSYIHQLLINDGFVQDSSQSKNTTSYYQINRFSGNNRIHLNIICCLNNTLYNTLNEHKVSLAIGYNKAYILSKNDMIINLCDTIHTLAISLEAVKNRQDMLMYRYCDIYYLLYDLSETEIYDLFYRAKEFGAIDKLCFVIIYTGYLFKINNSSLLHLAMCYFQNREETLHIVTSQLGKNFLYKEKSIYTRFFSKNRIKLLEEI